MPKGRLCEAEQALPEPSGSPCNNARIFPLNTLSRAENVKTIFEGVHLLPSQITSALTMHAHSKYSCVRLSAEQSRQLEPWTQLPSGYNSIFKPLQ